MTLLRLYMLFYWTGKYYEENFHKITIPPHQASSASYHHWIIANTWMLFQAWWIPLSPSQFTEFVRAELPNCFPTKTEFFICPEFWPMGIVDISFQRASTGKCATPTTHWMRQFDYLAETYELFRSAESKTIVHLLVWTQPWFPVLFWQIPHASLPWEMLNVATMRLLSS